MRLLSQKALYCFFELMIKVMKIGYFMGIVLKYFFHMYHLYITIIVEIYCLNWGDAC